MCLGSVLFAGPSSIDASTATSPSSIQAYIQQRWEQAHTT